MEFSFEYLYSFVPNRARKIETYSGLSKSNFKEHNDDTTKGQCLGMIAEINVFSASGEM